MNARAWFGLALCLFAISTGHFDPGILLITAPIALICLLGSSLIRAQWIVGWDLWWFTTLLFFFIAPVQSVEGWAFRANPYLRIVYGPGPFVVAALIVMSVMIPLLFVQWRLARMPHEPDSNPWMVQLDRSAAPWAIVFFAVALSAFIPAAGGLDAVLAPRSEKASFDAGSPVAFLLLSALVVLASFTVRGFHGIRNSLRLPITVGTCAALLLAANPFNTPRNYLAIVWTPVALSLLGRFGRAVAIYPILVLSTFVLLPILSASSRHGMDGLDRLDSMGYFQGSLVVPDVDVFDTLVHAVSITDDLHLMPLECTLSSLFFFVPRPWWPDKPVVGGLHIGGDLEQRHGAGTNNLSFFVGGDWFLDGGLVLVATLSLILSFIVFRLCLVRGAVPFTILAIGGLPILLRGPLGSNIGFPACLLAATTLAFLLARSRGGTTDQIEI